jgi:hypothetical protein
MPAPPKIGTGAPISLEIDRHFARNNMLSVYPDTRDFAIHPGQKRRYFPENGPAISREMAFIAN